MINFYRVWKDDKESDKKPKAEKKFVCMLCNAKINGLKDHVKQTHGVEAWQRYTKAESMMKQEQFLQIYQRLEQNGF